MSWTLPAPVQRATARSLGVPALDIRALEAHGSARGAKARDLYTFILLQRTPVTPTTTWHTQQKHNSYKMDQSVPIARAWIRFSSEHLIGLASALSSRLALALGCSLALTARAALAYAHQVLPTCSPWVKDTGSQQSAGVGHGLKIGIPPVSRLRMSVHSVRSL